MIDVWVFRKHFYRVCAAATVIGGIVAVVYGPTPLGAIILAVGVIWAILTP